MYVRVIEIECYRIYRTNCYCGNHLHERHTGKQRCDIYSYVLHNDFVLRIRVPGPVTLRVVNSRRYAYRQRKKGLGSLS